MNLLRFLSISAALLALAFASTASADEAASKTSKKKIVLVAGKPSHPPRMHEFNAGVQLLHRSLQGVENVECDFVLNGWPKDESVFDDANAIVFYMDGGGRHEIVQGDGKRLELLEELSAKGVGLGFMHYGVEVIADQAGEQMRRWIGGHYENQFSCNPIWSPVFESLPDHPVAQGVKPFAIKDEWYFNMRFEGDIAGNEASKMGEMEFVPILVAKPSDDVRDGPYVYPKGPYKHIEANAGRPEAMMWVTDSKQRGRGMGFTGGHFHDNWANDDYRKVVLNSFLWLAGAEVPESGVESKLSPGDIDRNLDPKKR